MLRAFGTALLNPRAVLTPDAGGGADPAAGRAPRWILLAAYLLGAKLVPIMDSVADAWAMHGLGILQALAPIVFVILPWILLGLALEVTLGRNLEGRDHLLRTPHVAVVVIAHLAESKIIGLSLPGPAFAPDLVGGLYALVIALAVRGIDPNTQAAEPPPPVFARLATTMGALLAALCVLGILHDGRIIQRDWALMAPVSRGEPIPAFRVPLQDGAGALTDDALTGKVTLLAFWTTWCGQCDAEMPTLARLHEHYGQNDDVQVIGVNCDDPNRQRLAVAHYLRQRPLPFPVALDDGPMRRGFRVAMYPHIVLIDGDRNVRYVHQGRVSERTLAGEIRSLLHDAK